jgi:hypothetical protein
MTKHECRMTNETQMTNDEHARQNGWGRLLLVLREGFDIRHFDLVIVSSFVIRHSSFPS